MVSKDTSASPPPPLSDKELLDEANGFSRKDWKRNRSNKQIVAESPNGPQLPAAFDPNRNPRGRFVPGHLVRSGGPRKRKDLVAAMRQTLEERGVEVTRKLVARAVGIDVSEVPENLVSDEDYILWMLKGRALSGSIEAFREIYDRLSPKPQRMVIDASVSAKRAPITGTAPGEALEAELYYRALTSDDPEELDELDEDAALPESESPDLSFLE